MVLGLGGSASTDGGAGLVQALGARLLDADGRELPPGGGALARLASVDLAGLPSRLAGVRVLVASDVTSPLLGPDGAAAVFGPQKGADAAAGRAARRRAGPLGRRGRRDDGRRPRGHARAPGPPAAPASRRWRCWAGRCARGSSWCSTSSGFDERLAGAALVVTGEGSLDAQSLAGKAPVGVLDRARAAGVPVVVVAGRSLLSPAERPRPGSPPCTR